MRDQILIVIQCGANHQTEWKKKLALLITLGIEQRKKEIIEIILIMYTKKNQQKNVQ